MCEPLLAFLRWSFSSRNYLEELRTKRLLWIGRHFGARLAQAKAIPGVPGLPELWSELPLEATGRILRSPAVWEIVRTGGAESLLARCLTAEYLLSCRPERHFEDWSALGDVWLGGSVPPDCESITQRSADGRFRGPSLTCGTPIDLSLPPVVAFPRAGVRAPRPPDAENMRASVERLNASLSVIQASASAAFDAVLDLVSNIVLRTDEDRPEHLQSASSAAALGRVVLVNAQADNNSPALLAEVLVHEATHTAISTIELEQPLITDLDSVQGARVGSPWTSALLPVHAFLHACLVWFALFNFWTIVERANIAPADALVRRANIRKGFESLRLSTCLAPYQRYLHPDTLPLLHAIQEEAISQ